MKRKLSVVLAISLVFGFSTLSFGQISITGDWLFDLSGTQQGVAVLTFDDSTFEGYGFTLDSSDIANSGPFTITGSYAVDPRGMLTGTFAVELDDGGTDQGTISGKVNKKASKINLRFSDGPTAKGIPLAGDPVIPESWTATVVASQGGSGVVFDTFSITKDVGFPHRVFNFTGTGSVLEDGVTTPLQVDGGFGVSGKNLAYGGYQAASEGDLLEEGVFFGKISSGKFSFKLRSTAPEVGLKAVIKGLAP